MSKHFYMAGQFGAIYDVDPSDGTLLRLIKDDGDIQLTGLVYDAFDGYFWGVTRTISPLNPSSLVRVNMTTGVITVIGVLGLAGGKTLGDITVTSGGQLYGVSAGSNPRLASINKSTGAATYIGAALAGHFGGCCEIISGVMYFWDQVAGQNLYIVDLSTGVFTDQSAWTGDPGAVNACSYNTDTSTMYINNYTQLATFDFISRVGTELPAFDSHFRQTDAVAWGPIVPFTPAIIPAPSLDADNGWFIRHLDHNLVVQQVYKPENLHFIKRISAVEDCDWEVSKSAVDTNDNFVVTRDIPTDEDMVKPWANHYQIVKYDEGVETKIMAGFITNTNGRRGEDKIRISGKDWLAYFDRRQLPYDPRVGPPSHVNDYRFGPTVTATVPSVGFSYQVTARDIAIICKDIINHVLARPFSLPVTESLVAIGHTIDFALSLGDTSTLLSILDGLSEYFPGFDYRISYDMEFELWSPTRYGDPDTTADDGPTGLNICWTVGDTYGYPPVSLDYTNSGPQATHLTGTGAGTVAQTQLKTAIGASDIQGAFWRLDGSEEFGDQAKTQDVVAMRTRKQFIYGAQEVHDIVLVVDPSTLVDFWNVVRPGLALWVREDLQFHEINSAQHILEMDCTVNTQGDARVQFGLNQIYNTSSHYGVAEG